MTTYQSSFTGNQIDQALAKAQTALQPGEGGVQRYATVNDLPMSGVSQGTLALVDTTLQGDSAVFLWNGNETAGGWYKLATVNLAPAITSGPDAAYALPNDGSPLVLTLAAQDPEGLPVVWSYSVAAGNPSGLATITEGPEGTFTVAADPAAVASQNGGTFSLTFTATDGVSLAGATSEFTLAFALPSRLLVLGFGGGSEIVYYDLENNLSRTDDAVLASSGVTGLAWVNRDLAIASTSGLNENPLFLVNNDGVLSRGAGDKAASGALAFTGTVAASDDARWCATVCNNSPFVVFYEIVNGVPVKRAYTGSGPTDSGESVAFHPGGRWAVVSDNLSGLVVFDLQSGVPVSLGRATYGLAGDAFHMLFSGDGSHLYFVDQSATVKLQVFDFNASTGVLSNRRDVPNSPTTSTQGTSMNASRTLIGLGSNPAQVLDISNGPDSAVIADVGIQFPAVQARNLLFSPDGNWIALVLAVAPFLTLYAIENGVALQQDPATLPASTPQVAAFSPAG